MGELGFWFFDKFVFSDNSIGLELKNTDLTNVGSNLGGCIDNLM